MYAQDIAQKLNALDYDESRLWDGKLVYLSRSDKELQEIKDKLYLGGMISAQVSVQPNQDGYFELAIADIDIVDIEILGDLGVKGAEAFLKTRRVKEVFADLNQFAWRPLGRKSGMELVPGKLASGTGYVRNRLARLGIPEKCAITTADGKTVITREGCLRLAELGFSPAADALAHPGPPVPVDQVLVGAVRALMDIDWYKKGDKYVLDYAFQSEATANTYVQEVIKPAGADNPQVDRISGEWAIYIGKEDAAALMFNGVQRLCHLFPKSVPDEAGRGAGIG